MKYKCGVMMLVNLHAYNALHSLEVSEQHNVMCSAKQMHLRTSEQY